MLMNVANIKFEILSKGEREQFQLYCWNVICEYMLTVILSSMRTHDIDNNIYLSDVRQCGLVHACVGHVNLCECVRVRNTGVFPNLFPLIILFTDLRID